MPMQMGMPIDSRQFDFVRELLMRISRPTTGDLRRIERSVRVGFLQNFSRQSIAGGAAWPALAPMTQRERTAQGYGATGPMLRRTNAYARSWTTVGGWTSLERVPTGWVFHVSSDHPWAFTHELGNRSRNVPRRPVRFLDGGQFRVIGSALNAWIDDVVRDVMT